LVRVWQRVCVSTAHTRWPHYMWQRQCVGLCVVDEQDEECVRGG